MNHVTKVIEASANHNKAACTLATDAGYENHYRLVKVSISKYVSQKTTGILFPLI